MLWWQPFGRWIEGLAGQVSHTANNNGNKRPNSPEPMNEESNAIGVHVMKC